MQGEILVEGQWSDPVVINITPSSSSSSSDSPPVAAIVIGVLVGIAVVIVAIVVVVYIIWRHNNKIKIYDHTVRVYM